MLELTNPICVALDSRDPDRVASVASATEPHVGMFKVGLTTYVAFGSYLTASLAARLPVFLDLKLHDIPAQVAGAVRSVAATGASLVTIHASGGAEMIRAAVDAAGDVTVLAVTVLTSMDDPSLTEIGMTGPTEKAVLTLAELAVSNGAHGLVCSPLEVEAIRARFGPQSEGGPLLVVPGIRPAGSDRADQRRTLTPGQALAVGADVLVIGRPITGSDDPARAAADLAEELA
jgi:orotidine-5'-phosphate decarboxylase